jgi:protein-tyrosine-phosphatase
LSDPPVADGIVLAVEHRFSVVFVCTGNRARSPLAEALLRRRIGSSDVSVDSCGTLDLGPLPALPEAVDAAARLGVDLRGHRARALRPGLEDRSLVLGFEPAHVAAAVIDGGAQPERTFTVVEFAELLTGASGMAGSPERIVGLANARRLTSTLSAPSIPDPLGGSRAEVRRTFERIDHLVAVIAVKLFGVEQPAPEPPSRGVRRLLAGLRRPG